MAYSVWLFAVTGDPVVQRLLPQLVDAVVERVPDVAVVDYHDGVAVAGCDLLSPGYEGSVVAQVFTEPGQVKDQIRWGLDIGGPQRLAACDTVVELILVGDMDWAIVRAILKMAAERWSAVLADEVSGFKVPIEDEI